MFCTKCGVTLKTGDRYCASCGAALAGSTDAGASVHHKLSRPVYDKKIAGVCAGFARYFNVDVVLVRILWLVLIFWPVPIGLVGYVIAWIVMPRDPLYLAEPSTGLPVTTAAHS